MNRNLLKVLQIFAAVAVVFGIYLAVNADNVSASDDVDYTVTYVKVSAYGSSGAVKSSTKTAASNPSVSFSFSASSNLTDEQILIAAQLVANGRQSGLHDDARYIDADGDVYNWRANKNDYWLIEKGVTTSSVAGASIDDATVSATHVSLSCPDSKWGCILTKHIRKATATEDNADEYRYTTVNVSNYYDVLKALDIKSNQFLIDGRGSSWVVKSYYGFPNETTWSYLIENGTGTYHEVPPTVTTGDSVIYVKEHMQIDGARNSEQAVLDATQTNGKHYDEIYKAVILDTPHNWSDISSALELYSSRVIDETDPDNKRVINFRSGKNTYLVISVADTAVTYEKVHVRIDGTRDSEQAVLDATQTEKLTNLRAEAALPGTSHTWAQISNALGLNNSRVIDETDPDNKRVLNFVNGKNTYLVVSVKE